jgi:hypothetical protein
VSVTSPSGILEIETEDGSLRLDVERGHVVMPSEADLEAAGRIIGCRQGEYRFTPGEVRRLDGEIVSLVAFVEAARAAAARLEVEHFLVDEDLVGRGSLPSPNIHMLPSEPLQNPLDELLSDLEAEAPGELLFAEIGVVTQDPRWWRGALELDWRRRGWQIRHLEFSDDINLEGLDLLIVHHQQGSARVGSEKKWLRILRHASESAPSIPVVWVAPLGDPVWVHQLIEAGVSFLVPAPQGASGEAAARFSESLSRVVDRQLQASRHVVSPRLPAAVSELVVGLLSEAEPDRGISSLLQLAAEHFTRGAVLMAEETGLRCRAGFGYPLDSSRAVLPRGVDLIERVIRSGEALTAIEPESSTRLARLLGIDELPSATALIPLGRSGSVIGVLVADREGEEVRDVAEFVLLVGRLGSAFRG